VTRRKHIDYVYGSHSNEKHITEKTHFNVVQLKFLRYKARTLVDDVMKSGIISYNLTDMGTHGSPPNRVLEVPVKWARPASGSRDLVYGPDDLRRPWRTLSRS
jgi:hypothetical protein